MDKRQDLKSILPYLPLLVRESTLFWPSKVVEALKSMAKGPEHSRVNSGEMLSVAICDIRSSVSLLEPLAPFALNGYALFFDDLVSRAESTKWFEEVLPALANFLLQLPSLLESHYQNADDFLKRCGNKTGLRILGRQEAGIVFLSQELIGALLACSFFCLFPVTNRGSNHLPTINFDELFASLYESYSENQENKIKCIVHYFERISSSMPVGSVSFERKVLPLDHHPLFISYPDADAWSKSVIPLCPFEAHSLGLMEDHSTDSLQVDFANKYIGGGALRRGCVQEEIHFMINPELIAGMLFLPSMADNEAIDIVGAERFSDYNGETNKALCGFIDQSNFGQYEKLFPDGGLYEANDEDNMPRNKFLEGSSTAIETNEDKSVNPMLRNSDPKSSQFRNHKGFPGIVTGNWGCGAFGGDPELKAIIQWLAASQALRPLMSYYTFGVEALENVGQVTQWILSHEWTVGDLWNMMVEYSSQRLKGETSVGFFTWLLP
ncbi:poly(ADP-ribose) glycohydrolase 1-like isoform X4 [Mangifera indica]|uniref:poly(ADP-ribose) glycohydrolase 1-like isoform X4 n=1 Tax=Mangifera indica TaxID=29780 RepID=UPI001CFC0A1F|nr:poly(ADP-ribose) glycohydrolase 1-like isoform X4 [Mangifera indica]